MNKSYYISKLQQDIKLKLGSSLDTPADFDNLSEQIKINTHNYISPTTLKRFFNYIQNNISPRNSTLSLLSKYIGYCGWEDYCNHIDNCSNKKNNSKKIIEYNLSEYSNLQKIDSAPESYIDTYIIEANSHKLLVKSIKPEYSENKEYLDKLKKEFDATFLAESINIPHVLGFGKIRVPYDSIIMEYIEGKNILETIKENKLSPSEVLPFIKQLCKTIDYLHSNRIILNHITPQNIIITNSGILKIIDFSNVEYMHNPIKEIKSDINSVGNILTQIDNIMPIKFQHIKKTIQKCNKYDYNSFNNASEIYNSLSGNKKFISIFITLFSILFTAIICSVLFYNIGKNSNTNYSYSEGLDINPGQDIGLSSSIIIYDTLSKLVIYDAQKKCDSLYNALDTISSCKRKLTMLGIGYRNLLSKKRDYPYFVLNKYLGKNCPEYNLYSTSLVNLSEQTYYLFFTSTLEKFKKEKTNNDKSSTK